MTSIESGGKLTHILEHQRVIHKIKKIKIIRPTNIIIIMINIYYNHIEGICMLVYKPYHKKNGVGRYVELHEVLTRKVLDSFPESGPEPGECDRRPDLQPLVCMPHVVQLPYVCCCHDHRVKLTLDFHLYP